MGSELYFMTYVPFQIQKAVKTMHNKFPYVASYKKAGQNIQDSIRKAAQ